MSDGPQPVCPACGQTFDTPGTTEFCNHKGWIEEMRRIVANNRRTLGLPPQATGEPEG